MAIDFHDRRDAGTYATREADDDWLRAITQIADPTGLRVVDVGCGGGIWRPAADQVDTWLSAAGLAVVGHHRLSERRRSYASLEELNAELRARTGRSILHELTDDEVSRLADEIGARVSERVRHGEPIHEVDHWTVWEAQKSGEAVPA